MRLSAGLVPPERWGRSLVGLVVVTAADRAAATCRRGVTEEARWRFAAGPHVDKGKITKPLQVRGGSVSRRGLNQFAGNRAHLTWGRTSKGTAKLIPSCFPGGSAREGPFSERPPPSHTTYVLTTAVDSTKSQETALTLHGGEPPKEQPSLFPTVLREGARGRGFLQISRLPRSSSFLTS